MTHTCEVPDAIIEKFNKFKLAKCTSSSALILKINKKDLVVEIDDEIAQDAQLADIAEELPESVPRYILFSYRWERSDGRLQFPILFIYYCPKQIKPELAMIYSSTQSVLQSRINCNKTLEVQVPEDLTEDWLLSQL
mmetsp:Transcript_15955/g.49840  ORF Transcript_15955/g.49840 Transcript_15955/m.49840 type:complete len:137 (-) Transcript_15955:363-773(-)